ncbi:MAG: hypothetical protein U0V70_20695 [Terriglobia bacterium]
MIPADLAGDCVIALVRYGETSFRRMTFQAEGDRVRVTMVFASGELLKLEGTIRDGKIELQQSEKDEPLSSMTGMVGGGEMSGEFVQGDWEQMGNALETSMDMESVVDVIPGESFAMPRVEKEF